MSTPRRQGPPMLGRSGQSLTLDQARLHLEQLKETRGGPRFLSAHFFLF